jgi:hypothetical protein
MTRISYDHRTDRNVPIDRYRRDYRFLGIGGYVNLFPLVKTPFKFKLEDIPDIAKDEFIEITNNRVLKPECPACIHGFENPSPQREYS